MKVFHLPEKIEALAFDMDLTLYSNREYAQYQIDSLVERLGKRRGLSFPEMNREVEEARKIWALSHNGVRPSLTDILCDYGISMEENISWHEIFEPGNFLKEDKSLKAALEQLSHFYVLGLITNNSILTARKTLAALGVGDCFSILVGLDTCMKPKPHKEPFVKFLELSNCPLKSCVSIGDRYDIDLSVPLEMGMGGILVDGAEDVYGLPELLLKKGGNYGV